MLHNVNLMLLTLAYWGYNLHQNRNTNTHL